MQEATGGLEPESRLNRGQGSHPISRASLLHMRN